MRDHVLGAAILVAAVWTVMIGLNALMRRQAITATPPPRPEWLREKFEKEPLRGPLAHAVLAAMLLPFIVPGTLLLALADGDLGRQMGVVLTAWGVGLVAVGVWNARPARKERHQARMLAHSEMFWSRPEAEELARTIRSPKWLR
jgi:hypothetical protein